MAGFELPLPRLLLIGGDGALSGVPRHIALLCETLRDAASITVLSDADHGGYAGITATGAVHREITGLRNRAAPWSLWTCWRQMRRIMGTGRWDIIWFHERRPAIMARLALALGLWRGPADARLVLSYHVIPFDPGQRPVFAALSRWLERRLLRRGPPMHLVFLTQDMILRLEKVVGQATLARHKLHVLSNSSNIGDLPHGPGAVERARTTRHIVITGRAGYQKNYALAARLFAHLPDNYHLTLCGPGTECVRQQARIIRGLSAGARDRIHFTGAVGDVRPYLAQADGYLLTSRYEGLPIGAIEAFEAGLPLMLSPFESAPEMVASHPMAVLLPLSDLPRDGARVVEVIEHYCRNRPANAARIRRAWARKYPYVHWQDQVRALLVALLSSSAAEERGSVHAAPAPLRDRQSS